MATEVTPIDVVRGGVRVTIGHLPAGRALTDYIVAYGDGHYALVSSDETVVAIVWASGDAAARAVVENTPPRDPLAAAPVPPELLDEYSDLTYLSVTAHELRRCGDASLTEEGLYDMESGDFVCRTVKCCGGRTFYFASRGRVSDDPAIAVIWSLED